MIFLKFFDSFNGKVEDYLRMCDKRKKKGAEFYIWEVCVYKPCKIIFKSNKYWN